MDTYGTIIALMGGAVGGSIINAITNHLANKKNKKIALLENKISKLYGPLSFMLFCTKTYLYYSTELSKQYSEYFLPNKFSGNIDTQNRVSKQSEATLQLSNYYFEKVIDNNHSIFKLIAENYFLIDDTQDKKLMDDFIKMFIRLSAEYIDPQINMTEIPLEIQENRGSIGTIANDFIEHIIQKNKQLDSQLHALINPKRNLLHWRPRLL